MVVVLNWTDGKLIEIAATTLGLCPAGCRFLPCRLSLQVAGCEELSSLAVLGFCFGSSHGRMLRPHSSSRPAGHRYLP